MISGENVSKTSKMYILIIKDIHEHLKHAFLVYYQSQINLFTTKRYQQIWQNCKFYLQIKKMLSILIWNVRKKKDDLYLNVSLAWSNITKSSRDGKEMFRFQIWILRNIKPFLNVYIICVL